MKQTQVKRAREVYGLLERALMGEFVTEWTRTAVAIAVVEGDSMLFWYDSFIWMSELSPAAKEWMAVHRTMCELRGEKTALCVSLSRGTSFTRADSGIRDVPFLLNSKGLREGMKMPVRIDVDSGSQSTISKEGGGLRIDSPNGVYFVKQLRLFEPS